MDSINWAAVSGLVMFVFVVLFIVASLSMGLRWKKIDFQEIFASYGKLLICGFIAAVAIGGGVVWATKALTDTTESVAPGISTQQPGSGDAPAAERQGRSADERQGR